MPKCQQSQFEPQHPWWRALVLVAWSIAIARYFTARESIGGCFIILPFQGDRHFRLRFPWAALRSALSFGIVAFQAQKTVSGYEPLSPSPSE
jgi:hypothetical protein